MKHSIKIFIVVLVIVQIGCTSTKLYQSNKPNYPVTQLIFKKDTFFHSYYSGLSYVRSEGTWYNTPTKIFLNSDSTYRNGFLEVKIQEGNELNDTICVQLISEKYNFPLEYAEVRVNNNREITTREDGTACFQISKIDSLAIHFLNNNYKWIFPKEVREDVIIFVNRFDSNKEYFENERWQKVEEGLLSPEGILFKKLKPCRKCMYRKSLKVWRELRKNR